MSDATKRGRPCLGFLARGERERTQGTCSTCDLPAAAHERIIFYAVTLPPLVAAQHQRENGAWEWPLPIGRQLWRPPTLVTVGLQRDPFGRSAYLAFQESFGRKWGAVRLVSFLELRDRSPDVLGFVVGRILEGWAADVARQGEFLAWPDLDRGAVVEALRAARETLELEEKAQGRTSP